MRSFSLLFSSFLLFIILRNSKWLCVNDWTLLGEVSSIVYWFCRSCCGNVMVPMKNENKSRKNKRNNFLPFIGVCFRLDFPHHCEIFDWCACMHCSFKMQTMNEMLMKIQPRNFIVIKIMSCHKNKNNQKIYKLYACIHLIAESWRCLLFYFFWTGWRN